PDPPTDLVASDITHNSATLTWTKSPGATSYDFHNSFSWFDQGDIDSFPFVNLTPSTAYTVQLRAKNAHGTSAAVSTSFTTLPAPVVPPAPTNVEVSDITHNSATISWTQSPGATSYEVLGRSRNPVSGVITTFFNWIDVGNVTSYTFTGFWPNSEGNFFIRALNSQGASAAERINFNTLPAPPRRSRDDEDVDDKPPPPTPIPIHDSLNHLPPGIQISNWVDGAQGKRIDHVGVGRADLTEQGILDAVDVYGYVTPGVEVCFDQPGRIVFLDAAYAPRRLANLPAYQRAGMTCAAIDRGGAVVLLRIDNPPPVSQSSQAEPTQPQSMNDCEVQPWANLKFRQSPPRGLVLGVTATRDWLPASEKRHGYFKVRLWGREGWISGDYVYLRGDCGV
ncbi:MAG: fibronectin type III domain-containing protein, partial [Chloroflexota bacterium]|nr:fibronectin type III domain-containing protein [Chloroflexota bacterium]